MHKDLDVWFLSLDLERLTHMFSWPAGMDAIEFIESCDDRWYDMSPEEKEEFYHRAG